MDRSAGSAPAALDELTLLDWKRQVHALYAEVRVATDPEEAWWLWRSMRDDLYRHHPQTPLPEARRSVSTPLAYFDYDPELRVLATIEEADGAIHAIAASGNETIQFRHFGTARFELRGAGCRLALYWLEAYGGGLFLPFADATSGTETYGGGRYLLDTVKGADLGTADGRLVLDFNLAYNPSCSYDDRWVCPLAPPANRLALAVRGGERLA